MRIVVLDGHTLNPGDNPWDAVAAQGALTVHPRTTADEVLARAAGAGVVLTNKTPLTAATLAKLPDLRLICVLATGTNVVDREAARAQGVVVCNVPEYGTGAVAQHTWALILALTNHVARHDAAVRAGRWDDPGDFCFWEAPVVGLEGKTLGVVGVGRIGARVASIGAAMGMQVLGARRNPDPDFAPPGFQWAAQDDVLRRADVLSLNCALTETNRHLINADTLAAMKPGALLVNTARGALIDEAALADALRAGTIAGAALDTFQHEPLSAKNPLRAPDLASRCLLTPHMAWTDLAARQRLMQTTADNIAAFLAGTPQNTV